MMAFESLLFRTDFCQLVHTLAQVGDHLRGWWGPHILDDGFKGSTFTRYFQHIPVLFQSSDVIMLISFIPCGSPSKSVIQ